MQPRKYARQPWRGECIDTAGWRWTGGPVTCAGPCYPNRLRPGLANDALAPAPLHYGLAAAQTNLGDESKACTGVSMRVVPRA